MAVERWLLARLWQMCESLDGAQRSQVRQDSVEELNFEAVLERAVSGRVEERLRRAQEEKAKLEELLGGKGWMALLSLRLLETMNSQVRTLEVRGWLGVWQFATRTAWRKRRMPPGRSRLGRGGEQWQV